MEMATKRRRRAPWWLMALVPVLTLMLVLQTPWGLRTALNVALNSAGVSVAGAHGNWLRHVELIGVTVAQDGLDLRVDTLEATYDVLALAQGRIHIRQLVLTGASMVLGRAERTQPDGGPPPPLQVQSFTMRRSRLVLPLQSDTTLLIVVDSTRGSLAMRPDFNVAVASIHLRVHFGQQPLDVTGAVSLADGMLVLDSVRLFSDASDVVVAGRVRLPAPETTASADLSLVATPLMLREVELITGLSGADVPLFLDMVLSDEEGRFHLLGDARVGEAGAAGRLAVDAIMSVQEGVAVRSASVSGLDLSLIDTTLVGKISAHLHGQLHADSVQGMTGQLTLELLEGDAQGLMLHSGQAQLTLHEQTAALEFLLNLDGLQLAGAGTARELGREPAYVLNGTIGALDLHRLLGLPVASDLAGTWEVSGKGARTAAARVHVGGAIGSLALSGAVLEVDLDGGALKAQARVDADSGYLAVDGTAAWGLSPMDLRATARLRALDAGAMLALDMPSRWTADVHTHLRGNWPPDSGKVAITLRDSYHDNLNIIGAVAQASVRGTDLTAQSDMDLAIGKVSWAARARLLGTGPALDQVRITFDSLDAGPWVEGWRTALSGTARVHGRRPDGFDVALVLRPSMVNTLPVDSGRISVMLESNRLAGSVAVFSPSGAIDLAFEGAPGDSVFALTRGDFKALDLGVWLGLDELQTRLTGMVDTAGVTGMRPSTLSMHGTVRLDSSTVNGQMLDATTVSVKADSGAYHMEAATTWAGGSLVLDSVVGRWFDDIPTYGARVAADKLSLDALFGIPATFSGRVALSGDGVAPEGADHRAEGRMHVIATHSRYQDLQFHDVEIDLALTDGVVRVDTLRIHSNGVRLAGSGAIPIWGREVSGRHFVAHGAVLDAAALATLFFEAPLATVPAPGDTIWFATTSRGDTTKIAGHFQVAGVRAGPLRVLEAKGGVQVSVAASGDGPRIAAIDSIWGDLQRASIPSLMARSAHMRADLAGDTLNFQASVVIDDTRHAELEGMADLTAQRIGLRTMGMTLGEERWHLDQAATISYGDEVRVRNLLLVADAQEVALDGVINPTGRQSMVLTLFNVQPAAVADLFGFPGLGGVIEGDLFFTGEATSPALDGNISMSLEAFGRPVGELNATVGYADGSLELDAMLAHVDRSSLAMRGYVPADLRLQKTGALPEGADAVALQVNAQGFNVGWVEPFLDPELVGDVEGRLTGSVTVDGTLLRPHALGSIVLEDGRLELPELGITGEGMQAQVMLSGDSVHLSHLAATSGGGTLTGQGTIALEDLTLGEYDLSGEADQFRVIDNEGYLAHVSGDLRLRGTTEQPKFTGSIRLINADIRPTEAASDVYDPVVFTPEDVRMLERYFNIRVDEADTTTFVFYDALTMALSVVVGEDVWIRSRAAPEMNVPFQGVLNITKVPGEDAEVVGSVQVVPAQSYVRQFGRRFDIDTGRMTFTGSALNPLIELRASYEASGHSGQERPVIIFLDVSGSILDEGALTLRLSSDPAILDESDIISYLATGRPAAEAFQRGEGSTLQLGRDIAVSQLTNLIAGAAGAELGLDIVEIKQEGSRGVTLTAGKRVSRYMFASISWPIAIGPGGAVQPGSGSTGNKEIAIEYSLFQWLLARLRGDTESLGASLVVQYAY